MFLVGVSGNDPKNDFEIFLKNYAWLLAVGVAIIIILVIVIIFVIKNKKEKLVYVTDTGMIPDKTLDKMKNADYYIIESNHNIKKLHQTNRPAYLKLRILSDEGHLSNEASAIYMSELVGNKTKEIILAHLSEEANEPELALKAYKKIFQKAHIDLDKIYLHCASQREIVEGGK